MKYYIIAGEASGDLHGSNLIRGLQKSDPQAQFRFWGGDLMAEAAGAESLARHYKSTSFFGFAQVLANARTIMRQMRECRDDIRQYAPDVLVCIDYPGFNFKMARYAHSIGVKVFYYISPKVWAWKSSRVKLIRRYVDRLFVIFPFEVDYFAQRGIEVTYEGNPLTDSIALRMSQMPSREEFVAHNSLDNRPIIALLAGSRKSEIRYNLEQMAATAQEFPDYQFVLAGVSWLDEALYRKYLGSADVKMVIDQTYELLNYSTAALVTSGTATLEAALIGTPEVVCYRGDAFSIGIARMVIKIRFISLVNIIMDREVVKELIQNDMTSQTATEQLRLILPNGSHTKQIKSDYSELRDKLGNTGASDRVAAAMVARLHQ